MAIEEVLRATDTAIEECTLNGLTRTANESSRSVMMSRRAVEDSLTPAQARSLHTQVLRAMIRREPREVNESLLVHHAVRATDVAAVLESHPWQPNDQLVWARIVRPSPFTAPPYATSTGWTRRYARACSTASPMSAS